MILIDSAANVIILITSKMDSVESKLPITKKKNIILFFTGFGKFGKVLENPTTYLSRALPELLKA